MSLSRAQKQPEKRCFCALPLRLASADQVLVYQRFTSLSLSFAEVKKKKKSVRRIGGIPQGQFFSIFSLFSIAERRRELHKAKKVENKIPHKGRRPRRASSRLHASAHEHNPLREPRLCRRSNRRSKGLDQMLLRSWVGCCLMWSMKYDFGA